jgi:hypothetical protein
VRQLSGFTQNISKCPCTDNEGLIKFKKVEIIMNRKFIGLLAFLVFASVAQANEGDARNFITMATDSVPSSSDPMIEVVSRQLETISYSCAGTSRGGLIVDKLTKAHSLLKVQQSLLVLLSDFVSIARAQCSRVDDITLISLYVLERNAGASHIATVAKLIKNPRSLIAKWK